MLIDILNEILANDNFHILSKEWGYVISGKTENYPEDYIELKLKNGIAMISEVHRDDYRTVMEIADEQAAIIYTAIVSMRLFDPLPKDGFAKELREQVKNNNEQTAKDMILKKISNKNYEIGNENPDKISLIYNGDRADVKYKNKYLAQNVPLPRAYSVLYNYSRKLEYICLLYENSIQKKWNDIDFEIIATLYILGCL